MKEDRKFKRVQFEAPARVDCGGPEFEAWVLDISLKGVLLRTPDMDQALEVGQQCRIRLVLDESRDESAPHIDMQSVIKNRHDHMIGAEWLGIELDDLTILRRLLEFNLGDDLLVERELAQLRHD